MKLAVALLVLVPVACATGNPPAAGGLGGPVTVEVRNHNWLDVHAYVVGAGQRFSLGLVTSNDEQRFTVPSTALSSSRSLVFIALPVGSRLGYVSDEVYVEPGDAVLWTIQNNLALSTVSIR